MDFYSHGKLMFTGKELHKIFLYVAQKFLKQQRWLNHNIINFYSAQHKWVHPLWINKIYIFLMIKLI